MTKEERKELAMNYFLQGYNCSQSVVLAFKEYFKEETLKDIVCISSPFGGGMSRLRETCGAISGAFIVLGKVFGYETPETGIKKANLYELSQEFVSKFTNKYDSIRCYKLLNKKEGKEVPVPENRTPDFYAKRPCKEIIGDSAYFLQELIDTKK